MVVYGVKAAGATVTARGVVPGDAARVGWLAQLGRGVATAARLARTRQELAEMEPRMLRDVGLSGFDVRAELARAPWDGAPRRPEPGRGPRSPRVTPLDWISEAWRRSQSRRMISGLDEQSLKDMGVSWSDAEREANKPFWRA